MSERTTTKERPILFSDVMVRAILEDGKTQTRRVIKPQPKAPITLMPLSTELVGEGSPKKGWTRCPYGQPGDHLWVRESAKLRSTGPALGEFSLIYRADEWGSPGQKVFNFMRSEGCGPFVATRWTSSIHLPRWASRISLEVTGIRVERIQEISERDAEAEGVKIPVSTEGCPEGKARPLFEIPSPYKPLEHGHEFRAAYSCLWDEINAKRGFGWKKNPWVWVIEFMRVK